MNIRTIAILTLMAASVAAGAYGGTFAGKYIQRADDEEETRNQALVYNCGGYNPETGVFEWKMQDAGTGIFINDPTTKKLVADQNKLEAERIAARKAEIERAKKKAGVK